MTASEVLRKARALIEKPERWHILGAIREACPSQGAYYAAIDEGLRRVQRLGTAP